MTTARAVYASASAVIVAAPSSVSVLNIGVGAAGQTVKLHNCTSVGAAAPGNLKGTFDASAANSFFIDAWFDTGVVAVFSGGAVEITVTVGG